MLASSAAAQSFEKPPIAHSGGGGGGTSLDSLNRIVRHFDFEEAARAPYRMPINFYRHIAPDAGYPPFGEMTLANDHSYDGDWSFRLALDGGSMAARIPTAIIPVAPHADYAISVWTRTESLNNATVRMAAWFHDTHGRPILESRVETLPVQSERAWRELNLTVAGDFDQAADLVVELMLEQLHQRERTEGDPLDPVLTDVFGSAWFDALTIRHQPRIVMQTRPAGNIIEIAADGSGESIGLELLVRDVASEVTDTRLRVFDYEGHLVHEQTLAAPRGPEPRHVPLPIRRAGWYRAEYAVMAQGEPIRKRSIDFAILAPAPRVGRLVANRFGVIMPDTDTHHVEHVPMLVQRTLARRVVVSLWPSEPETNNADVRELLDDMIDGRTEYVGALNAVPPVLAETLSLDADQVAGALADESQAWRTHLQDELIRYGLEINRWIIGRATGSDTTIDPDPDRSMAAAVSALGEFIPRPAMFSPNPAGFEPTALPSPHGHHILIPHHVRPDAIEELIDATLPNDPSRVQYVIEPLPADAFTPRQRAVDLVLRVLHAWRATTPEESDEENSRLSFSGDRPFILLDDPWRLRSAADADNSPDVMYPIWRTLCDLLNDRSVVRELDIGDHEHCWLLEGDLQGDDLMVAWTDIPGNGPSVRTSSSDFTAEGPTLDMVLGADAVTLIDPFGNRQTLPPRAGVHHIALSDMPVFIEDASHELGMFRAAFEIVPSFLAAENRIHEHEMVLHNPWDVSITGTVQINPDENREIQPSTHTFTIKPGADLRLPVEVLVDRRILAGPQKVKARVIVAADRQYELEVQDAIDVGLPDLHVDVTWYVTENEFSGQRDLVFVETITNHGEEGVSLDCFLLAPQIQRRSKPIPDLAPGARIHRSFRIPDGVNLLSGQSVRIGIVERGGVGRLNYALQVPDFNIARRAANVEP